MCLIVDANTAHLLASTDALGTEIFNRVSTGKIRLATGGKHKLELLQSGMKRLYQELRLAGALIEYDDKECRALEKKYAQHSSVESDDAHILGLAHLSGCRLLCSFDIDLCDDFRHPNVLPKPRGKVLQNPAHDHLFRECPQCRDPS